MNLKRRLCAILLAVVMLMCAGCGGEDTPKRRKKKVIVVRKPDVSQADDSSSADETPDDSTSGDFTYDDNDTSQPDEEPAREKRPLAEKETVSEDKYVPEYTVKTAGWSGPDNYRIVYPKDSVQLKNSALKLRDYFKQKAGVSLAVTDDSAKAQDKEILVGNTNRKRSSLSEKRYGVSLYGSRLFFESGNFNGVIKAVKWFVSLNYQKGKVNLIDGEYDFESVKKRDKGNFKFVWGDDFDGDTLDAANWDLTIQMDSLGYLSLAVSKDKKNISVSEGKLKLSATKYFDPRNANVKYAATYTVGSRYKMNFQYGYMELRARYPIKQGAWPSWWLVGDCGEGPAGKAFPSTNDPKNKGNIFKTNFGSEVDILEYITGTPNIHKWYFNNAHTQLNAVRPCSPFDLTEKDSYIYHIFGFEWNHDEFKVYCDGNLYQTIDITESYDNDNDMEDFRNPMLLFFNNHVLPDSVPSDNSSFPFDYYIDYVRLYQKDNEGGLWLTDLE